MYQNFLTRPRPRRYPLAATIPRPAAPGPYGVPGELLEQTPEQALQELATPSPVQAQAQQQAFGHAAPPPAMLPTSYAGVAAADAAIAPAAGNAAQPLVAPPVSTPSAGAGFFKRAGQLAADNPMGVANAALGVAGAVINATTKRPEMPAYQDFTPTLAPAMGMDPGQKQLLLNRLNRNTLRAGQVGGPDTGVALATRLQAAATAGEQQLQLESQDQQILQQNQQQRSQQQLQTEQYNHQGRTQQRQAQFTYASQQAEGRKAQGTAMVQGAATYAVQADASRRQEEQTRLQGQYQAEAQAKQSRYVVLMQGLNAPGISEQQRQYIQAEMNKLEAESGSLPQRTVSVSTKTATRAEGGPVPMVFKRGGSVSISQEISVGNGGKHVDPVAAQQAAFRRSMDQVTDQATRQFGETMRAILRARTQSTSLRRR